MKNYLKYAVVGVAVATMLLPLAAGALGVPTTPVQGQGITVSEVLSLLQRGIQVFMTVAVIVAVLLFVWGGLTFMRKPDDGKAILKNTAIGTLVILGVGVIMNTLAGIVSRQTFN